MAGVHGTARNEGTVAMSGSDSTAPRHDAFWHYSLAFYARPGVAEACLCLQDEAGVDVNVLLYLLYLAETGWTLDASAIERLEILVVPWRDAVVRPLRGVRQAMKSDLGALSSARVQALRNEVKRIELEAERLQQESMQEVASPAALGAIAHTDRHAAARASLAAYEARCAPFPGAAVTVLLTAHAASTSRAPVGDAASGRGCA